MTVPPFDPDAVAAEQAEGEWAAAPVPLLTEARGAAEPAERGQSR